MGIKASKLEVWKFLRSGILLLLLAACQEDVALLDRNGAVVGKGRIGVHANSSTMHMEVDGKEFSGTWKISAMYSPADEKRYKLMGGRSYDSYLLGNAADAMKHAHAEMAASDGERMECDFYFRRTPDAGVCSIGEKSEKLTIQQIDTRNAGGQSMVVKKVDSRPTESKVM